MPGTGQPRPPSGNVTASPDRTITWSTGTPARRAISATTGSMMRSGGRSVRSCRGGAGQLARLDTGRRQRCAVARRRWGIAPTRRSRAATDDPQRGKQRDPQDEHGSMVADRRSEASRAPDGSVHRERLPRRMRWAEGGSASVAVPRPAALTPMAPSGSRAARRAVRSTTHGHEDRLTLGVELDGTFHRAAHGAIERLAVDRLGVGEGRLVEFAPQHVEGAGTGAPPATLTRSGRGSR